MNDDVKTPEWLKLYFGDMLDPCPFKNTRFDGLQMDWKKINYVNPPYSNVQPWIDKAFEEREKGNHTLMLLRVDVSTKWYRSLCEKKFVHIAYFNERIFKGSNFCSMLVFIEGKM